MMYSVWSTYACGILGIQGVPLVVNPPDGPKYAS